MSKELSLDVGKEDYNEEPVYYCKKCLSLNIRNMPIAKNVDYCDDCSSTDIGTCSIDEWNKMYKEKYGHDYVIKIERKWPYWC